ncbi:MAG: signal peptidase I [Sphingomonadales bacterium]
MGTDMGEQPRDAEHGASAATDAATKDQAKEKESWGDFFRTIVYALLIALAVRTVAYEPFNIPSESMLPNLLVGDYLFVSKYAYGYSRHSLPFGPPLFQGRIFESQAQRGDVVVFKLPRDGRTDYIKRVIGLPGDRVQLRAGVVHINGQPVKRERIDDFVVPVSPNTDCRGGLQSQYRTALGDGSVVCKYPQYLETLPNGRSYRTLDLSRHAPNDNSQEFLVPPGHYFMMGDNRDASLDSRAPISVGVGFVPAANLVGRAEMIFYSTNGQARLWTPWNWVQSTRFGRMFQSLRH